MTSTFMADPMRALAFAGWKRPTRLWNVRARRLGEARETPHRGIESKNRWCSSFPMGAVNMPEWMTVWAAVQGVATVAAAGIAWYQIGALRKDQRAWKTLEACERYESDLVVTSALKCLRDARKDGSLKTLGAQRERHGRRQSGQHRGRRAGRNAGTCVLDERKACDRPGPIGSRHQGRLIVRARTASPRDRSACLAGAGTRRSAPTLAQGRASYGWVSAPLSSPWRRTSRRPPQSLRCA